MSAESGSAASDRARVALVGLGSTTASALDALAGEFDVITLIRDSIDETTRRATDLGIPVESDASLGSLRATLGELRPDLVVVSSYNRIIDAQLIELCPFLNVHYAPLPRGRGRATVNWAILNGDVEAAITIHHLVAGLDAGGLLFQRRVPITATSTVSSLYELLNEVQRLHLADAVRGALDGEVGEPQLEDEASYLCTRTADDGEVDWSCSTRDIDRLMRSLGGAFPSAFTWLGLDQLHIDAAEPRDDAAPYEGRIPGRVVAVDRRRGTVDVLTGDGVLCVQTVRVNEGAASPASDVITSVKMTLGLRTADLVRALRAIDQRTLRPVTTTSNAAESPDATPPA